MPSLAAFNGKLYLAWAGTDSAHHLNVAASSDGTTFGTPTVLNNTAASDTGPAITVFNGLLYIAWQGGDGALNVISSSDGVNFGNQLLVSNYTSSCTPAIAATSGILYVAYCFSTNDGSGFDVASSVDGVNWSASGTVPPGEFTYYTPALAVYDGDLVSAYTFPGSVNTDYDSVIPLATTPATTLGELRVGTSVEGLAFGVNVDGGPAFATLNGLLYMAWFTSTEAPALVALQTSSTGGSGH